MWFSKTFNTCFHIYCQNISNFLSFNQSGFGCTFHPTTWFQIPSTPSTLFKNSADLFNSEEIEVAKISNLSNFCFLLCTLSTDAILGNFMSSWFTRCLRNATFFKIMVPENARLLGKGKYHWSADLFDGFWSGRTSKSVFKHKQSSWIQISQTGALQIVILPLTRSLCTQQDLLKAHVYEPVCM